MKFPETVEAEPVELSLPSRERGLKLSFTHGCQPKRKVAPLAGARIEIPGLALPIPVTTVAPLAGARIEMHERSAWRFERTVAPLAGARIEINKANHSISVDGSLPSRERGLKYLLYPEHLEIGLSLPSRERGLKCKNP